MKLKNGGHVRDHSPVEKLTEDELQGWYIPYHVVHTSGKYRLVFNSSFQYQGQNLNGELLARPTFSSSLVEVLGLLRFQIGRVAISGDIAALFHQVRLSPADDLTNGLSVSQLGKGS